MSDNRLFVYENIVKDMNEGVLTISADGTMTTVNAAGLAILGMDGSIVGKKFAAVFFGCSENDSFNQTVLDAVYENTVSHNTMVDYYDGTTVKKLFMSTSFLKNGDEKIGVVAVMNDITELTELRDALTAMEKIKALNAQLEVRNEFIKKTFGRYLSDDIVNSILNTDGGLTIGGKKEEVTIMFSDIRGFTAVSERMEPHALIAMLNHYLAEMITVIQSHNGTILEFIGDAIVVVFGAPIQSATRDFDAVACAVEMQCRMREVNEFNTENGYPQIEMGIGIHTGEVVLGNIGSEKKTKYDIIGKNVNLASRIETYTVGGQILISPVTRSKIENELVTRGETEIMPKGVKTPITIYDVASVGSYVMPDTTQHFKKLKEPINISFRMLDGKFAGEEEFIGKVTELSEKEAVLVTDHLLEKNDTVKFFYGEAEIFAKTVRKLPDGAVIHFTFGNLTTKKAAE